MSYINDTTGTTVGPLRIQLNGPAFIYGVQTETVNSTSTNYNVLKLVHNTDGTKFDNLITDTEKSFLFQIPTPPTGAVLNKSYSTENDVEFEDYNNGFDASDYLITETSLANLKIIISNKTYNNKYMITLDGTTYYCDKCNYTNNLCKFGLTPDGDKNLSFYLYNDEGILKIKYCAPSTDIVKTASSIDNFVVSIKIKQIIKTYIPYAGKYTVPNIAWVMDYVANNIDSEGNRINVSLYTLRTDFDVVKTLAETNEENLNSVTSRVTILEGNQDNTIFPQINTLKEEVEEDLWILDGGSPSGGLR